MLALLVVAVIGGLMAAGAITQRQEIELVPAGSAGSHMQSGDAFEVEANRIITFGFDLRTGPEEDARRYAPFLSYLEKATGYYFNMHFVSKDSQLADELGQGAVQFAVVGAAGFLKAHRKYGAIPLVHGLNRDGKGGYQSVIIAAADSPVRSIADLPAKSLAFGRIGSTQGHFIPLIVLEKAGVKLIDLGGHAFTGSHQNCAAAVISGEFDACALPESIGQDFAREGRVKIIHVSGIYPSRVIAANRDVPPEVIENIRQALLDFEPLGRHGEGLYKWDKTDMATGFERAQLGDYAEILVQMNRLGFLK